MGAQVKGEIEMDQLIDCVCIPCITDIYFSLFARHSILGQPNYFVIVLLGEHFEQYEN